MGTQTGYRSFMIRAASGSRRGPSRRGAATAGKRRVLLAWVIGLAVGGMLLSCKPEPTATESPTAPPSPTVTPTATPSPYAGPVPEGALARLGRGTINKVAPSPDGEYLAVAGPTGLYLYRLDTFEEVWANPSLDEVRCVAWSPDGTRLASGSASDMVSVWDAETGERLHMLKGRVSAGGGRAFVESVAWSPDGSKLASGSGGNVVIIWEAETGEQLLTLEGHTGQVMSLAWSPDGARLASGSWDNTVVVWDVELGEWLLTFELHTDAVEGVAWSPDGSRLASASRDGTVIVWDAETGKRLHKLADHTDFVESVAWSPDGSRLASASWDGTVMVWDAETGERLLTFEGHTTAVGSVAWLPGRDATLVSASYGGAAIVWDAETGQQMRALEGHTGAVIGVAWSPDGTMLASGSVDGVVRVWAVHDPGSAEVAALLRTLEGPPDVGDGVAWSPDGTRLASASWDDNVVIVWDVETGEQLLTLQGHADDVRGVVWSPDGSKLASGSADQTVIVWDAETGEQVRSLVGHEDTVTGIAWSPDGTMLASGSYDQTVIVWDVETGEQIHLIGPAGRVSSVAWSPDGSMLASGSWDDEAVVWDVDSGERLLELEGPMAESVAWSPDGFMLASGNLSGLPDEMVVVWDAETGAQLPALEGHNGAVFAVAWSPDGSMLASGSLDGTVILWDATHIVRPPTPIPTPPGPSPTPTLDLEALSTGPFRPVVTVDDVLEEDFWYLHLHVTPDGTVWLYSDRQVAVLRDDAWSMYMAGFAGTVVGIDNAARVWAVNEDVSEISVWNGAYWVDYDAEDGWTPIEEIEYAWQPVRRGVHTDRAGRVWIATARDVRVFDGERWTVFTRQDMGMDPLEYPDEDNNFSITILKGYPEVWVGECDWGGPGPVGGQGVRWFDGQTWHGADSPVSQGCAGPIVEDSTGRVWAGVEGTLWQYDPASGEWTSFAPPKLEPPWDYLRIGVVLSISLDTSDDPWVVFLTCGGASCDSPVLLYHLHDGVWTCIAETTTGWFTDGGYAVFDVAGANWLFREVVYLLEGDELEPVAALSAQTVVVDAAGRIWFMARHEGQNWLWTLDPEAMD
jgi:WD40 repeat protein